MWKIVIAVIVALAGVALNLYYNQSIPEGMPSQVEHVLRMSGAILKCCRMLAYVGSLVGFGNFYTIERDLQSLSCRIGTPKAPDDMEITNITLAGVPVRVYKPFKGAGKGDKKLMGLIYYHGGGWTIGGLDDYHFLCYKLSKAANMIVVSVNYRLAPEHTYPAQFDDCFSVTTTLLSKGEQHGIDTSRIIVGGDSAGGNLAAAISQQLKDQKNRPVAQILVYPAVQNLDFNLPSFNMYGDTILDKRKVAIFWSLYLNATTDLADIFLSGSHAEHLKNTKYYSYIRQDKEESQAGKEKSPPKPHLPEKVLRALTDPKVAPLMAESLVGLPHTLLISVQFDVLSSEGLLYKLRLEDAGVEVTHLNFQSFHGFYGITFDGPFVTDEGKDAFSETVKFLKQFE